MSIRVTGARSQSGGIPSFRPEVRARSLNASRPALLFGTALGASLAVLAAAAPNKALAADECGVNLAGVDVRTCTPGVVSGGIEYLGGDDLTVVLPASTTVTGGVTLQGSGEQTLQAGDLTSIVNTTGGFAVDVVSTDGSASVTVDDVTSTGGAGAGGVSAVGLEGASVTVNGDLEADDTGVAVLAVDGDALVANNGTITSGSTGVLAQAGLGGNVGVTNSGAIAAVDAGISASAVGGDVSVVNDETIVVANTASAGATVGIEAGATGAGADVAVTHDGTLEVDGLGAATGISVDSEAGHATVQGAGSIDVFTTGMTAVGVDLTGGGADDTGATVVLTGDINVEQTALYSEDPLAGTPGHMWYDFQAVGVQSVDVDGPLSITVGDVNATGYVAQGVVVQGADPASSIQIGFDDITIQSGGGGGHGVFAYAAAGGDVAISGDTVTTFGDYSDGVNVGGAGGIVGDVDIAVNAISTDGFDADGVHVDAEGVATGDVRVSTGSIVVAGENSSGVEIESIGGDIEVTSGSISVADGVGIDLAGDGDVTVTSGDLSATGGAGMVLSSDAGDIDVTSSGALSSDSAGVLAQAGAGDVTVTVDGDVVIDGVDEVVGVSAQAINGHVTVDGDGSIDVATTGATALGVAVSGDTAGVATDTGVTIDLAGPITVEQTGVFDIDGGLPVDAFRAVGVEVLDVDGPVDVAVGDVTASGRTAVGVLVETNDPTQPISISFADIDVASNGGGGAGVSVDGAAGADVSVTGDSVVTAGDDTDGVSIGADGDVAGDVTVDVGSIVTAGDLSDGVVVNADGAISVVADSIETFGDSAFGVRTSSSGGPIDLAFTGDVTTHGTSATGVAAAADGDVTIVSDGVVVTTGAGAHGVVGSSTTGDVSVTGAARVSGLGADALQATSAGGDGSVTVNGPTSSVDGYGVLASAAGTSNVTVLAGATVSGDEAGVFASSGLGTTIVNNGTITGLDGVAIDVDGAAARITNRASGTIEGGLDLTAADDVVVNDGTFVADVDSDFGLGVDRFTNTGTVVVNGDITFAGLENFDNRGLVDMIDGVADDVLDLNGGAFNGLAGSALAVDVNLGTGVADRLVVGDITGVTTLQVETVGDQPGVLGQTIDIVDSASNETGAELVMAENLDVGFVEYALAFDAGDDAWSLVGEASEEAFQPLAIGQAAQDFWQRSADAWSAQMRAERDGQRGEGVRTWAQVYAGGDKFDSVRTFDGSTVTRDLSTDNAWQAAQAGVDTAFGNALVGVTFGYADQQTDFQNAPNDFEISGWNVGAYAAWRSGALFANGLVKGDFYDVDADFSTAGLNTTFDGRTWGVEGEVGYRFGGDTFVEPVAGLSWTKTDLDGFSGAGATVEYDDLTSLQGRIGARVGTAFNWGGGVTVPFAGLYAVNEFDGENAMRFSTGPTGFTVVDEPRGAYGKFEIGASTVLVGGLEAFAVADTNFGGDASGVNARIGARWRW